VTATLESCLITSKKYGQTPLLHLTGQCTLVCHFNP